MITDNYIKMCEKAEEIQSLFKHKKGDWIYWGKEDGLTVLIKDLLGVGIAHYLPHIWLPTQEQLQEIILPVLKEKYNKYWDLEKMKREGNWVIRIFFDFIKGNISDKQNHFIWNSSNNITELWFAFVMYEKYNKIWNGEDWIIENKEGIK